MVATQFFCRCSSQSPATKGSKHYWIEFADNYIYQTEIKMGPDAMEELSPQKCHHQPNLVQHYHLVKAHSQIQSLLCLSDVSCSCLQKWQISCKTSSVTRNFKLPQPCTVLDTLSQALLFIRMKRWSYGDIKYDQIRNLLGRCSTKRLKMLGHMLELTI